MSGKLEVLPGRSLTGNGVQPSSEPLLTAAQVAQHLGVQTSWVYEKAALGVIPSVKVGVYRRFRLSQIEQWLEEVNP